MPRFRIRPDFIEVDARDLPTAITFALTKLATDIGKATDNNGHVRVEVWTNEHQSYFMKTREIDWSTRWQDRGHDLA